MARADVCCYECINNMVQLNNLIDFKDSKALLVF